MTKGIVTLIRLAEKALEYFLSFVTLTMTALILAGVFFRYVLGHPLVFSFEISTVLFAWIVFIGLVIAYKDGFHLGVDIIDGFLPPRARHAVYAIRNAMIVVISLYMVWQAGHLFMRTAALISSLQISVRVYYFALPLGFSLMAAAAAIQMIRDIRNIFWSEPSSREPITHSESSECS